MEPDATITNRTVLAAAVVLAILSIPYFGFEVLVPVTAFVLIGLSGIARADASPPLRYGACVALAHSGWMLVMAVAREVPEVLLDVAALGGSASWCLRRPGALPLFVLGVFQAYATFMNVGALWDPAIEAGYHPALHLHVALRLVSLGFLAAAARRPRTTDAAIL